MHSLQWLWIGHRSDDGKVLNFLHHLPTPPRLLRILWIRGDVDRLPDWVGSLTHLISFTVARTTLTDDEVFGVLCKLPNLKTLYVTWEHYHGDELIARTSHRFPVLRDLIIGRYLPKVVRFEQGSMAMLERLELNFKSTHMAERSIVGIEQLPNLKKVVLEGKKDNPALNYTLELLKAGSDGFSSSNQFQIAVKYV
jgi:disease resistance protein RPM1